MIQRALLPLILLNLGSLCRAESDWPQWRGPNRNGISAETGLLGEWPGDGPRLAWKVGNLGRGWSSPIVVGKQIYITGDVGDDLVVWAFDLDGAVRWRTTHGKAWTGSYPGARACCVYSDGRLYLMNAHGRVACLDAASGRELWALDVLDRFQARNITWGMSECLLVDGPRLIITPGGEKGLMAALDKQNGLVVWTTEPLSRDRATYSSPILFFYAGRRLLANCSSGHGFGVDADSGKLLWTVPLRNRYDVNVSSPLFGDGCLFYVTADEPGGTLYRLRAEDQGVVADQLWHTALDTCTGGGLMIDGRLYGSGYRKVKTWLTIDWHSGRTVQELPGLAPGSAVYAEGRLYGLSEEGRAVLLKPIADGLEIVGQIPLVQEKVRDAWAHPVLVRGRLYLRYHETLWCYDVRAR